MFIEFHMYVHVPEKAYVPHVDPEVLRVDGFPGTIVRVLPLPDGCAGSGTWAPWRSREALRPWVTSLANLVSPFAPAAQGQVMFHSWSWVEASYFVRFCTVFFLTLCLLTSVYWLGRQVPHRVRTDSTLVGILVHLTWKAVPWGTDLL